jgi:hypothetical protein
MNNIAEMIHSNPFMRQSFIDIATQWDPALGQKLTQNLQLLDTCQGQLATTLTHKEKEAIQWASVNQFL